MITCLPRPYFYLECIELYSHISVASITCNIVLAVLHVWLLLDHLQWFVVILNLYGSAIYISCGIFLSQNRQRDILSLCWHIWSHHW